MNAILDHWQFPAGGVLADNFAGSGTTLLAARERGLAALGFDLSPLAVMVAKAKIAPYNERALDDGLSKILGCGSANSPQVPHRLSRAFTEAELKEINALLRPIRALRGAPRNFFLVALLCAMREFSRAVPDGGWFRWQQWPDRSEEIRDTFKRTVALMLDDVGVLNWPDGGRAARVRRADARKLPLGSSFVDGLITSPPYPNRHDYSRVFHIELLLLGAAESQVTKLRHRSIRSHVEAKPPPGHTRQLRQYKPTATLQAALKALPPNTDRRIRRLLRGYFEDIYLSLVEVARILRPGGRAAYVIGNVRYAGVMIPVDEITAELASQAGLDFDASWVMRLRGNAAQQMGRYGREPSRESVVLLSKATG
ncbi:MAG: hypothetical protein OXN89_08425 [Bryobacterales bacterium]|nr:hypothetical protein [Bryobacterales bacterium]